MTEPLSREIFDQQVGQMLIEYGEAAFAAVGGDYPSYTLFADEDKVIAITADDPRHRYGTFCELNQILQGEKLLSYVRRWLEQGEAYNLYISMNVCRYNC